MQVQAPETKKEKEKKKNLSAPRPTMSFIDVDLAASIDRATKMSLVCRCTGVVRWLHGGRTRPGPEIMCVCVRAWPLCVVAPCTEYRVLGTPRRGGPHSHLLPGVGIVKVPGFELRSFFLGFFSGAVC